MILVDKAWKTNSWKTNQTDFLFVRQVYKFLPINLGACKPIFYYYFLYTTSEEKDYYEAPFLSYLVQNAVFPHFFFVCKTNCIHSIFRTIEAHVDFWLAKPFKTFPKSPIRPPVLTFDKRQICEEIFKELPFNVMKNLLSLFFFNGFITMCNLKKRLIRLAFWVLLQAMFMNGWKQTAKRWKLHFWGYQQSIKKYNSVEHLQRQKFSFTKTNEYLSVSKNP